MKCHFSKGGGTDRNKTSNKTLSMDVTSEYNSKHATINEGTGGKLPITNSNF